MNMLSSQQPKVEKGVKWRRINVPTELVGITKKLAPAQPTSTTEGGGMGV